MVRGVRPYVHLLNLHWHESEGKKVHHKRRDRKMKKTMDLTKRHYQAGHEKVSPLLAPGFFREPLKWWLFKTHFLLAVGFGSLLLGWRTFSRPAAKKPSITDDSKASDKCESSSFVPGSTDSRWLTTLPKNQHQPLMTAKTAKNARALQLSQETPTTRWLTTL